MNGSLNVKNKLCMIIEKDEYFAMWKEFKERHHYGELINPNTQDKHKDKV